MAAWECASDAGWQPYPPTLSAKIEKCYQSGNKCAFQRKFGHLKFSYECNFDRMKQINTRNGTERAIRRSSQSSPLPSHNSNPSRGRWQCYADRGWVDFDPKLNGKVERAFKNNKPCTFSRRKFTYRCDFVRMKQVGNTAT